MHALKVFIFMYYLAGLKVSDRASQLAVKCYKQND